MSVRTRISEDDLIESAVANRYRAGNKFRNSDATLSFGVHRALRMNPFVGLDPREPFRDNFRPENQRSPATIGRAPERRQRFIDPSETVP